MKKKLFALLLLAALFVGLFSLGAYADDPTPTPGPWEKIGEAESSTSEDDGSASTLSEGSVTVVVAVVCLAAGLAGGYLVSRKKTAQT